VTVRDLVELELHEAAHQVAVGEVSPVDLVQASLERAHAIEDTNAFISILDDALEVAEASAAMLRAGYRIGPLHGVPIALKDNINMRGTLTTAGSAVLENNRSDHDATVVSKLRAAGAIVVGKTNMHEFAWGGTSANPNHGFVKNPWDMTRMPAGSSGGSGVAVASRACQAALGTDTGGSVRLPAAVNGITGLRPTIGRVSNAGVIPLAWSMDTVGPMARSARDCALLLSVIAGHDAQDPGTPAVAVGDYLGGIDAGAHGLRIGLITDYSLHHMQPPVEKAIREAIDVLVDLGAVVKEVGIEDIEGNISAQLTVEAVEPSTYHQRNLRLHRDKYGDDVRLLLQAGELIPAVHYVQAQRYRALLRQQMLAAFEQVDVIICPTLPFTATPLGETLVNIDGSDEEMLSAIMQFTGLPSLTGLPALSAPCGFDHQGLPIGVQMIGRPFAEAALLRAATAFQSVTDHHRQSPSL
jgi:aspartyl-tRNA(Asn)/glutamyl-tRNA(Gln) amidotransferase subunit A